MRAQLHAPCFSASRALPLVDHRAGHLASQVAKGTSLPKNQGPGLG